MTGNRGLRRTVSTPGGYIQDPGGRVALFNQCYVGFVMENRDALNMGRIKVWIPEFSTNREDAKQWFTVNYCSPWAGATPLSRNTKDGKKLADTQQSYGMWMSPPDLENEVVVMFVNGDPNRGIYIGGLFQQFMNQMVPGIASAPSFDDGVDGNNPPVAEYNKRSKVGNSGEPVRPRYDPLHNALKNQGLYDDYSRGVTSASARRGSEEQKNTVTGTLTPGGTQFVFDDGDDKFVRLRTANGTQVLINDTTGFVYINSRSGNSWVEVSDDGLDMYTSKSFSVRAQQDINFHADGNINMYAKKGLNTYSAGNSSHQAGKSFDILAGTTFNASANGAMNLLTNNNFALTAGGTLGMGADGVLALKGSGAVGVTAGGTLTLAGAKIQQANGSGPSPKKAAEASAATPTELSDRELNVEANYPEIQTRTIVSRLVTHEPFELHPGSNSGPDNQPVDLSSSSRVQIDGNATPTTNPNDIKPGDVQKIKTDNSPWICPVTGTITSLYGPRIPPTNGASSFHGGIDVANKTGTPVVASKAGRVVKAGVGNGYGNVVYLDHGGGVTSRYAHLSAFKCVSGQQVAQGQVIGLVGNTGVGTGPHLHFEIRSGGNKTNPAGVLPGIVKGSRVVAGKGK